MTIPRHSAASALAALLLATVLLAGGCNKANDSRRDLQQIQDSGQLTVLTMYGPASYFIYRDSAMGLQYETARQLAAYIGVQMNIVVARSTRELIEMLNSGEGDLIAYDLPITNTDKDSVLYCGHEFITHQVIVQRDSKDALTDVTELIGKDVYVKSGHHYTRMKNLNDELGGGIRLHEVTADTLSAEGLMAQVNAGEIDYSVADNDVARLNRAYYPNLNINLAVSFDQRSSWAVRKTSTQLAALIDRWSAEASTATAYISNTNRYFMQGKRLATAPILSVEDGQISAFDDLFKRYAPEIGWDWRLLASLAYTESNFDPDVVSRAGAQGLMQLMPVTAHNMGVPVGREGDPEESVRAAVKYLSYTSTVFGSVPNEERHKFVLAAYNSGIGHVLDAMALAEKYGRDKYVWEDNVERYLLLKSNEEYYTDPVCKNGYLRGAETEKFVRITLERYERYRELIRTD